MDILKPAGTRFKGDTLITFPDVPSAIRGEKILKRAGHPTRLVAPPPKFRLGCDLGLEILASQQQEIMRLFREHAVDYARVIVLD
jgi:hypothetical protein